MKGKKMMKTISRYVVINMIAISEQLTDQMLHGDVVDRKNRLTKQFFEIRHCSVNTVSALHKPQQKRAKH